jgi:hypothetical protein
LLIVVSVLVVLYPFWLFGRLTNQHVDVLAYWLPRWCYLGRSLAHGHIPTWLPYQAGGVPFASDPQSGWLYLPAMLLFATSSCTRAIGLVIVLHPLLGGLGMYGFFRNERVGRPAATVGALTLALTMSGSVVVLSLPFSAAVAWTAIALWGASGYFNTRSVSGRLGWLGLAALGLGQVAAAHLTNGFLIGVTVLVFYMTARSTVQVRSGERSVRSALVMGLALFAAFVLLSAAILIPRLALSPRTALAHGYLELDRISTQLSGRRAPTALAEHGLSPWWGTSFARGPGGFVGALAILLIGLALSSRRWRLPAAGFALLGLIGWALNLDWVVRSKPFRSAALATRLGELWLRSPPRFQYLLILSFAALAGYGLQAWLDVRRRDGLRPALWFVPSVAIFALWPLASGALPSRYLLLAAGMALFVPLLLLAGRGAKWAGWLIPPLVAVELSVAGLVGQAGPVHQLEPNRAPVSALPGSRVPSNEFGAILPGLERPSISPTAYAAPGDIGRALIAASGDHGRYFTFDPKIASEPRGFLLHQDPASWPAYEDGRSILFRIDEVQGYLSVQIDRFWRLVRRIDSVPIYYNAATLQSASPQVLRLFGVEWMILRRDAPPPTGGLPVATEGPFVLYRLPNWEPRASIVFEWVRLAQAQSLDRVLQAGFDPARVAVLEGAPTIAGGLVPPAPGAMGSAVYEESSPEYVRIRVTANAPGVVVVRNAFDRNWQAWLDGKPAPLLRADYLMQAVPVPAGGHLVELRYRDRSIGVGLAISGLAWGLLGALFLVARRRERRRAKDAPTSASSAVAEPARP